MGMYEFDGEPQELLVAYDRLAAQMPTDDLSFHACVRRDTGIVVYDCCPSEEVFRQFSTSADLLAAMRAAGLPAPVVTELGWVHVARSRSFVATD